MLQHRGPFEFPRRLIKTPALPPFSIKGTLVQQETAALTIQEAEEQVLFSQISFPQGQSAVACIGPIFLFKNY